MKLKTQKKKKKEECKTKISKKKAECSEKLSKHNRDDFRAKHTAKRIQIENKKQRAAHSF